ncbi:DDE-type integrase/transposase/recombinase [Bacillus sp. Fil]|uniref:DDE-type integrase/transposase/recombinase n=1 Tax=Bacillus sp. Fil TaxID=3459567 RepID=UPI00403A83C1
MTYINVKGDGCYLYGTIDKKEHTLDIQLCKRRNQQATYDCMKSLIKRCENQWFSQRTKLQRYFAHVTNLKNTVSSKIPSNLKNIHNVVPRQIVFVIINLRKNYLNSKNKCFC